MSDSSNPTPLVESRQAAIAKLAYAVHRPGSTALLCGPAGSGVSTVLSLLGRSPAFASRTCGVRPLADWCGSAKETPLPDIVLADDCHAGDAAAISALVTRCHRRSPAASLVLAGHGRLVSLVARDPDVEDAVLLRAVLHPFTFAETRCVLDAILFDRHQFKFDEPDRECLARTIHEIAAGIPAAISRLAELATVVAADRPDRGLSAADIEAIHRRLGVRAA
ncbi:hypothetical protein EBR04_05170 [bacterium]|nr:hypothetical protein [bacterium]